MIDMCAVSGYITYAQGCDSTCLCEALKHAQVSMHDC